MALHDITVSLRGEKQPWPGDTPFTKRPTSAIQQGEACNVSHLSLSSHYGTHLDAPFHFDNEGFTLEKISLDALIGPALVHPVDTPDLIFPCHLPPLDQVERILFKTPNSHFVDENAFREQYVSLSLEAAQTLTQARIKLVGIDYFSVESYQAEGHPVHHELCGNNVILVEGINLRLIEPGWYELMALPLKIEGCDGSPCRVVLRDL